MVGEMLEGDSDAEEGWEGCASPIQGVRVLEKEAGSQLGSELDG